MSSVRPKRAGDGLTGDPLSPEEGFVLSRIDGNLSVDDLGILTGMGGAQVEEIVSRLASRGAVVLDAGGAAPPERALEEVSPASLADFAASLSVAEDEVDDGAVPLATRSARPAPRPAEANELVELGPEHEVHEEDAPAESEDDERAANAAADAEESEELRSANEQDYRKIYETRFHALPPDARVGLAKVAHGSDLLALCLDVDPRVVAAVLENPTCGLSHVRLIALHHRTATGLEIITRRTELLRDMLVERRLLKNPMSGDTVLGRVLGSKRLFQTYKIAIDRDVPELTRVKGRGFLRQKWGKAASDERADLILKTEGRCLVLMTGCTFDARTTSILCGKQYNSILFIQNYAKFPATPPALLAHLYKTPFVRKIPPLRKLLLQHPNMPGEVKRQG
ncbi:MAG: hypothetical protein JWP97_3230 [Labilithrix sp.]|nr:hypothetical protein [Labilithrix sp.]